MFGRVLAHYGTPIQNCGSTLASTTAASHNILERGRRNSNAPEVASRTHTPHPAVRFALIRASRADLRAAESFRVTSSPCCVSGVRLFRHRRTMRTHRLRDSPISRPTGHRPSPEARIVGLPRVTRKLRFLPSTIATNGGKLHDQRDSSTDTTGPNRRG